jgi:hypothetical protein
MSWNFGWSQGNTHVLTGKFDLTNVNNMAFYISGPKLLFETTEISTHPNSTQHGHWLWHFYLRLFYMFISQSVRLISDNIWIGLVLWHRLDVYNKKLLIRNKCAWVGIQSMNNSSEFDSTGVKLYIFIHNEVRDFDKNSTQPKIWVNRVRDNESQLYIIVRTNYIWWDEDDVQFVLDQHA